MYNAPDILWYRTTSCRIATVAWVRMLAIGRVFSERYEFMGWHTQPYTKVQGRAGTYEASRRWRNWQRCNVFKEKFTIRHSLLPDQCGLYALPCRRAQHSCWKQSCIAKECEEHNPCKLCTIMDCAEYIKHPGNPMYDQEKSKTYFLVVDLDRIPGEFIRYAIAHKLLMPDFALNSNRVIVMGGS